MVFTAIFNRTNVMKDISKYFLYLEGVMHFLWQVDTLVDVEQGQTGI